MTPEAKAAYVAGIFDGEGHIGCHPSRKGSRWSRMVQFSNTDKGLVDTVVRFMLDLGLAARICHNGVPKAGWSEKWTVYLAGGRPAFERFAALIPIQAEHKKRTLDYILRFSYVSEEEKAAARRKGRRLACAICGAEVYRWEAVLARTKSFRTLGEVYCSPRCRVLASQRGRVAKICEICGGSYEVIPAKAAESRFCSRVCRGKSHAEMLRGQAQRAARARWG